MSGPGQKKHCHNGNVRKKGGLSKWNGFDTNLVSLNGLWYSLIHNICNSTKKQKILAIYARQSGRTHPRKEEKRNNKSHTIGGTLIDKGSYTSYQDNLEVIRSRCSYEGRCIDTTIFFITLSLELLYEAKTRNILTQPPRQWSYVACKQSTDKGTKLTDIINLTQCTPNFQWIYVPCAKK